ncbi:MAG: transcriptional regulator [Archaeoglobaceae archaeon]|nr:transcriptional regulator [Archaeoglobaceae archaeon]MCX8151655.1 transcriptional regulator [Archaeoglobaceae archaeon]MDW8013067.1 transcriptional regulator [Archaeoglobaceae archaeon]
MLEKIAEVIEKFRLKPSDLKIYYLLVGKHMSASEIAKELKLSSRFVRERLKDLYSKGILKRTIIVKGWIGYVYTAEDPQIVLKKIKNQILSELSKLEN